MARRSIVEVSPSLLISSPPVTRPSVDPMVPTQVSEAVAVALCSRPNNSARRLEDEGT